MPRSIFTTSLLWLSLPSAALSQAEGRDTVVIQSALEPIWGHEPQLVEDLRIGMLEGTDEYVFGFITALAVGLDGSIFVYDAQVPVIRQYDPTGRYVRDVGREGQGPGEYRRVMGMHVMHDGRLATWDPGNTRLTMFDSAGAYLSSYRVPSTLFGPNLFYVDTAGYFYIRDHDRSRMADVTANRQGRQGPIVLTGEIPNLLIRVSPTGEVVDSIDLPSEDMGPSYVLQTAEGPRRNFPTAVRYTWSNRGYAVVGRNDRYVFDLLIPDGPVRRIVRDFRPIAVSAAERDQWQAWSSFFERRGNEEYPPPPVTKPVFRDLYVDDDGRIWVDRYVTAVKRSTKPRDPGDDRPLLEWLEPPTFDVIGPDGTFFGTLVVPENTVLVVRRGNLAWGVHRGEFDEQYVIRFKITRGTS